MPTRRGSITNRSASSPATRAPRSSEHQNQSRAENFTRRNFVDAGAANHLAPLAGRGRKPRTARFRVRGRLSHTPASAVQSPRRPSPRPSPRKLGEGVSHGTDPPMPNSFTASFARVMARAGLGRLSEEDQPSSSPRASDISSSVVMPSWALPRRRANLLSDAGCRFSEKPVRLPPIRTRQMIRVGDRDGRVTASGSSPDPWW